MNKEIKRYIGAKQMPSKSAKQTKEAYLQVRNKNKVCQTSQNIRFLWKKEKPSLPDELESYILARMEKKIDTY